MPNFGNIDLDAIVILQKRLYILECEEKHLFDERKKLMRWYRHSNPTGNDKSRIKEIDERRSYLSREIQLVKRRESVLQAAGYD